ncbi:hypothetical protein Lpp77_02282 [Lacticaseibacillus paracasei subsp. paracasei CNCM I-4270]|uniref:Uncharacterized protein n=1 Tax=Lacticaseibacillus paracasei subsp. paracasei CNCM I-4270 TaxID=1256202 RepID=A0A8E0IMZ1_LACPA|nr:hypothetical protein Lpp77_02282 [Lacticaseibacillus paracasei subsp. paracasei CNCM I-4270]
MAVDKTVLFKTVNLGTICIFVKIALLKSASLFLNGKSLNTTKKPRAKFENFARGFYYLSN